MPQAVIAEWRANRERRARALARIHNPKERQKQAYQEELQAFAWWDEALDRAERGPRWLSEPQVGELVVEALHYRDGHAYDLVAFCVMPNHVHLVCTPLARQDGTYYAPYRILQSLKRHTARRANGILGRQGAFWQAESYDHVVRDTEELTRIVQYVIANPVKAGLAADWESWPWTYVKR